MKTDARKKRLLCSRIGEFHPSSQQFYFTNTLHFLYLEDTKCKGTQVKEEQTNAYTENDLSEIYRKTISMFL